MVIVSFSFVQLQGKPCTKKAFFKENPYEKAFFSTMLALKKALKGKKWEGVISLKKELNSYLDRRECASFFMYLRSQTHRRPLHGKIPEATVGNPPKKGILSF